VYTREKRTNINLQVQEIAFAIFVRHSIHTSPIQKTYPILPQKSEVKHQDTQSHGVKKKKSLPKIVKSLELWLSFSLSRFPYHLSG
jgi:hypothetical protein